MKTIMIYNEPFNWFNLFEPVIYSWPNLVEENVKNSPYEYNLYYSLPEMKRKDLKLKVKDNQIIIEGNSNHSKKRFFNKHSVYSGTSFVKTIPVTKDMNVDNIKAKFKNSMLHITIPKKEEYVNYKEIPVQGTTVEKIKEPEKEGFLNETKNKFLKLIGKAA